MTVSPVAGSYLVVVDGKIKYETDSLKRARTLRRLERMFHRHVVIWGEHEVTR